MNSPIAIIEKKPDLKNFLYEIQGRKDLSIKNDTLRTRKNVLDLKIVVLLDVSGSIGQEEFTKFMLQIDKIRGLSVIRILEFDVRVRAMYDYFKTSQNEVMRLQGGGGTFFAPAFEQAKKLNPDAIIIMSDMQNFDVTKVNDPGIPTASIIAAPNKEQLEASKAKYPWIKNIGSIIVIRADMNETRDELNKDMKNDEEELEGLESEDEDDEE